MNTYMLENAGGNFEIFEARSDRLAIMVAEQRRKRLQKELEEDMGDKYEDDMYIELYLSRIDENGKVIRKFY